MVVRHFNDSECSGNKITIYKNLTSAKLTSHNNTPEQHSGNKDNASAVRLNSSNNSGSCDVSEGVIATSRREEEASTGSVKDDLKNQRKVGSSIPQNSNWRSLQDLILNPAN